jgi:hypothetical protein
LAHFGKSDDTVSAIWVIFEVLFASPDLFQWKAKVPIPLHSIHGEIKVGVEEEWKRECFHSEND